MCIIWPHVATAVVMRELILPYFMSSQLIPALARRVSDNSNSGRQPAEADPNKKKSTRKTKGAIKVNNLWQLPFHVKITETWNKRTSSELPLAAAQHLWKKESFQRATQELTVLIFLCLWILFPLNLGFCLLCMLDELILSILFADFQMHTQPCVHWPLEQLVPWRQAILHFAQVYLVVKIWIEPDCKYAVLQTQMWWPGFN